MVAPMTRVSDLDRDPHASGRGNPRASASRPTLAHLVHNRMRPSLR
jgi:hypothetical protein